MYSNILNKLNDYCLFLSSIFILHLVASGQKMLGTTELKECHAIFLFSNIASSSSSSDILADRDVCHHEHS